MSISYRYDSVQNLIIAKARGIITVQNIWTYTQSVIQDDTVKRGFIEVVDFADVEDLVVTYKNLSGFRHTWEKYIAKGCRATLILAPTDFTYGVSRMFQTVIGANDIEGGGPFYPVRSQKELKDKISEIRGTPFESGTPENKDLA